MRPWHFWWRTLIFSTQYNPPQFIELVMLLLAMVLLTIWGITQAWQCLVLGLSYLIGVSMSILVREALIPSQQMRINQVMAVLLLAMSVYAFALFARPV